MSDHDRDRIRYGTEGVWLERDRLRAEVERLTAERDEARKAVEQLLKHAASEEFWQQQSVDHWDKPGPHNAAVKALRAISNARALLAPAGGAGGGAGEQP